MKAQFLRFLIVGGIAATVNFCSRIALNHWLPFAIAIVLAYCCGLISAFLLNRKYVFASSAANPVHRQLFWFIAVNVVAVAQTLLVSLLLARYVLPWCGMSWHPEEIAHAVGIIVPIFTSYFGHKRLSFA